MKKVFFQLLFAGLIGMFALVSGCGKDDDDNDDDKPKELTPREQAIKDYNDNYLGTNVQDPSWTGQVNGCLAGTISQDSRNKAIQRLNYFRRLVGLSDKVTENPGQHAGCQEASLVFKAKGQLSHTPPSSWPCYTQAAYDAAKTANIALGSSMTGPYAVHTVHGVSGFIEDAGSNNTAVGHRSWFLMPGLFKLGIGSTSTSSCMQWKDNYNTTGNAPEFIAYPPKGYMPNEITFPRWSFTIPTGATFTNAQVVMTDENGTNVSLNVINKPAHQPGSYPLRHLVWEPSINVSQITKDVKYNVTISNVTGAPKTSYSYEVIIVPVTPAFRMAGPDEQDDRILMSPLR